MRTTESDTAPAEFVVGNYERIDARSELDARTAELENNLAAHRDKVGE